MESRYFKLKEVRKALLRVGNEKEAAKVLDAMKGLVEAELVSAEEIKNAAYL